MAITNITERERELSARVDELEAELEKARLHIKHIGNDALRAENAELRAELASVAIENKSLTEFAMMQREFKEPDDVEFGLIEQAAAASFMKHQRSVKGQQITRSDSYESHLVWAAKATYEAELAAVRNQQPIGAVGDMESGRAIIWYDYHTKIPAGTLVYLDAGAQPRCSRCDGTGDVHSIDGEWRGVCDCGAGAQPVPCPRCAELKKANSELAEAAIVKDGWQIVPVEPTPEMIAAYLSANTTYWDETDRIPLPPGRWRTGTPSAATAESYKAMLAAAKEQK